MSPRQAIARTRRLMRITRVALRHRLDEVVRTTGLAVQGLPLWARTLLFLIPTPLLPRAHAAPARRLRQALEDLGPVFVKFGQILSTRRDLLPPAYAEELQELQDRVPPFPGATARALVETALETPLDSVFATFNPAPLASASVAQVHEAQLHHGDAVVVKVVRPAIHAVIEEDLRLLHGMAAALERFWPEARRLHPVAVVRDYERTLAEELDLLQEAANTSQLRRNFVGSELLYVPRVYWDYTRTNVLVLERIDGIPIANLDALEAAGTDMAVLAHRGVETFFTQVFEDNFFHADMHPGNIFVDATDPANPRYIAVDCAIIGSLTEADQSYLARNLLAFFHQDYHEVARLHVESGWVPRDTDVREFEQVIRGVCEPIFQKPLKEISFGHFMVTLFRTARRFEMEVQPQLVLLQKTLLNIEGLGRQLYPELDLWHTAQPFMERWMATRAGPMATFRAFTDRAPELLEALPRLPAIVLDTTRQVDQLERQAGDQRLALEGVYRLLERERRDRRRRAILGTGALITAGALLWPTFAAAGVSGTHISGGVLALVGLWLLLSRL